MEAERCSLVANIKSGTYCYGFSVSYLVWNVKTRCRSFVRYEAAKGLVAKTHVDAELARGLGRWELPVGIIIEFVTVTVKGITAIMKSRSSNYRDDPDKSGLRSGMNDVSY